VPETDWLADPTHRVKATLKGVFSLDRRGVKERHGVTQFDFVRLKKYWVYLIKQNRGGELEVVCKAIQAPLERLFDKHKHCGPWCRQKEDKMRGEKPKGYYRSIETNKAL